MTRPIIIDRKNEDPRSSLTLSRSCVGGSTHFRHAGRTSAPAQQFLLSYVGYKGTECVNWPFARSGKGYANVRWNGRTRIASRLICELTHGAAPAGQECAHNCGNRLCINPSHLRWDTPINNHADKKLHGTLNSGSKNGAAKLTDADVLEILRCSDRGETYGEIANRFHVSDHTIYQIATGQTWQHITAKRRPGMKFKLNLDAARTIRSEYAKEKTTFAQLSERHGVSDRLISAIVNNRVWREVSS